MFSRAICCLATIFVFAFTAVSIISEALAKSESLGQLTTDYILQPYDLIKVEVFQEPDLGREVRLSQEATITLPLIGTIGLKGKSVHDAQDVIRKLYAQDYLINPQINVIVIDYSKVSINVLGSVNSPGAVLIPPDQPLKLLDAITHAGGFSRLADRKRVKLTRTSDEGKATTHIINADDIIQSTSDDKWILQKGDVIFVPERIL